MITTTMKNVWNANAQIHHLAQGNRARMASQESQVPGKTVIVNSPPMVENVNVKTSASLRPTRLPTVQTILLLIVQTTLLLTAQTTLLLTVQTTLRTPAQVPAPLRRPRA